MISKLRRVLRDNNMFAHAIYHYVQCFEKCKKSILAYYYLSYEKTRNSSHRNEIKATLQSKVKEFEEECKKPTPDQSKLKSILNYVRPNSKDVVMLLIKYALDKGIPFLFNQ